MYELTFSNKGGLVMPLIIEWTYKDGSKEINRIDAQVWRKNENKVTKSFIKNKEVASVKLDPMRETADINESNNTWNVTSEPSKFQLFKSRGRQARGAGGGNNPMQKEIATTQCRKKLNNNITIILEELLKRRFFFFASNYIYEKTIFLPFTYCTSCIFFCSTCYS